MLGGAKAPGLAAFLIEQTKSFPPEAAKQTLILPLGVARAAKSLACLDRPDSCVLSLRKMCSWKLGFLYGLSFSTINLRRFGYGVGQLRIPITELAQLRIVQPRLSVLYCILVQFKAVFEEYPSGEKQRNLAFSTPPKAITELLTP